MAYLREKAGEAREQSLALSMLGESSPAAARAGMAQAFRDAAIEITAKRVPTETTATDTTWQDPAARRSKKENLDA